MNILTIVSVALVAHQEGGEKEVDPRQILVTLQPIALAMRALRWQLGPSGYELLRPLLCVWEIRAVAGLRAPARSRLRGPRGDTLNVPGLRAARREEGDVHYAYCRPALDAQDRSAVVLGISISGQAAKRKR